MLLSMAAGQASWRSAREPEIAVMIDASASTRGASYHDPAALKRRIDELLGGRRYRLYEFADETSETSLDTLSPELPSPRTVYSPPAASAVLLFSDGRFALPPTAPPTYAVIDPALDSPADGRIANIELRDRDVIVTAQSNGIDRDLRIAGAAPTTQPVDPLDRQIFSAHVDAGAAEVVARLGGHDAWPENDQLAIRVPPPQQLGRWWIGQDAPPSADWRHIDPQLAPQSAAEYLAAGVVVLSDVRAHQLADQQPVLDQYVRSFGGGLMFIGGEHAFAAGGYPGSMFELLSPLSSNPPAPLRHWMILVDSSGSMASRIGDNTRWRFATTAIEELVPALPPADPLSIGNFAAAVRWWTQGDLVSQTNFNALVPHDVRPQGPTNLGPALREIAKIAQAAVPSQLVVVTDAQADLPETDAMIAQLTAKRVTVNALTTQPLDATNPLRRIVNATGGRLIEQDDPRNWEHELEQLFSAIINPWIMREPVTARFTDAGPNLSPQRVELWNRTWLKPTATLLAEASEGERPPLAAAWNLGAGAVISCAYRPSNDAIEILANRVAVPPRDPRFAVQWEVGRDVRVTIDAQNDSRPANHLPMKLELYSGRWSQTSEPIPQTGPGRYALTMPALSQMRTAVVQIDGHLLDRRALPGRYPAEFDAIGNNLETLTELAKRTGGEVIEPMRTSAIDFPRPPGRVALSPLLSAAGAAFLAAGLIRWRLA